ncbi:NAD(P)/FAD-dependent oxidoreductase [Nocardioides sp.]|uniref:dihydrolipoyl dehydrogenase family protein n=1 Tax=Nocardioides sp. TaxID=35761 RepID=UPI002608AF01|nr:NAD(P)/FAD-dependent oxidoreductase [Nocardioides sp.]
MTRVDLIVIGTGPGGESLANHAARAGLSVVAVDKHLVGGECPYYGCIPSKMMLRGAHALADAARLPAIGGEASIRPAWSRVAHRIRSEATDDWDDTVAVDRLRDAGVTVHHGTGRLTGPGQVSVETAEGETLTYEAARGVVLNPGTRPAVPPIPGLAQTPYWTNREAVAAESVPAHLIVLGGGPIGCEMAQAFARFGSRVTIVEAAERLISHDEPEAAAVLRDALVADGIRVLTGVSATGVEFDEGTFWLTLDTDERISAERLLVAVGRTSNLDGVGLDSVGLDPRALHVDDRMRAADGLWVIGDVVGAGAYTHLSMYQSDVALHDLLGQEWHAADYRAVPHVTFTDPEVAGVGMTEAEAREAGIDVVVGSTDLGASSRAFTHGPGAAGVVKIVAERGTSTVVGASVAGPAGGEIVSMLVLAVHARVPVATLRSMIYAYPTFHRAVESALPEL